MNDPKTVNAGERFGSQMLEAALQTAVGAIIVIDGKGHHSALSIPRPKRCSASQKASSSGTTSTHLMPEPFRSRHDGYLRHHLETGERKIIGIGRQVMARRKSGAIFPAHLSVSAFEVDGRRYFTGIVHDLSDQPGSDVLREQTLLAGHLQSAAGCAFSSSIQPTRSRCATRQ